MEYNKKNYEEELKRKQKQHLDQIKNNEEWKPCLHDQCPECVGTGTKKDGTICVHHLYCNCPKCTVTY